MGHPTLRKKAKAIEADEFGSDALLALKQDLIETMNDSSGIGIAAPQIDVSKQICIVNLNEDNPRYELGEAKNTLYVVINPRIKILDKTPTEGLWEGCLSVPGLRGFVKRPRRIQVTFYDEMGEPHKLVLKDMLAVVFQHEIDHLNGKLFVDRLVDSKYLSFEANLS
jgi:peptide deformylase